MNVLTISGRLGKDCEVRTTQGGTPVAGFSVANDVGYGDRKQTLWFSVSIFGKRAESGLIGYLKKGQEVVVSGEMSTREHEGKIYLQIKANDITLVGGKSEVQNTGNNQQAPAQSTTAAPSFDDFKDDIPFS